MSRLIAIIWILLVALLHAIPGSDLPKSNFLDFFQLDKLVHAVIFAVAFFLITRLFTPPHYYQKERYIIIALILYGLLLEFCQGLFFIERSMDIFDWLADTLGILFGVLIVRNFQRLSPYVFKKS